MTIKAEAQFIDKVIVNLDARAEGAHEAILAAVTDQTAALEARVLEKLSGEVLKRRTGHLADSIHSIIADEGPRIIGAVATGVRYAAYQEYGFQGVETVREHVRRISQAFGRPISPRDVVVRQHQRSVDYPAHSYMRSSLTERAEQIRVAIAEAAAEGVAS